MSESPPSPDPDGSAAEYERIDASAFVESDAPAAGSHSAAEGVPQATEAEMGRESRLGTLRQMALETEPSTPLEQVESPWDPDLGGVARIHRGIQKATGVDGLPAVADVFIGTLEWVWSVQIEEPGRDRDGGGGEPDRADGAEDVDPITAQAVADET